MDRQFTDNEWETCLKVLKALKDDPLNNPDNVIFKGLITKIHKNAKKAIQNTNYRDLHEEIKSDSKPFISDKNRKIKLRQQDISVLLNTEIAKQAQNNTTLFHHPEETKRITDSNSFILKKK